MDAISLAASVINIAQAVIGAIKFARTLYKAPDDLAALEVRKIEDISLPFGYISFMCLLLCFGIDLKGC